jgi:hypothetical protein
MINSNCVKIYHMGAFVEPFESVNLSQALITDGCELKVIISQKKLMLVQMLVEVFGLLTASIQTIKE